MVVLVFLQLIMAGSLWFFVCSLWGGIFTRSLVALQVILGIGLLARLNWMRGLLVLVVVLGIVRLAGHFVEWQWMFLRHGGIPPAWWVWVYICGMIACAVVSVRILQSPAFKAGCRKGTWSRHPNALRIIGVAVIVLLTTYFFWMMHPFPSVVVGVERPRTDEERLQDDERQKRRLSDLESDRASMTKDVYETEQEFIRSYVTKSWDWVSLNEWHEGTLGPLDIRLIQFRAALRGIRIVNIKIFTFNEEGLDAVAPIESPEFCLTLYGNPTDQRAHDPDPFGYAFTLGMTWEIRLRGEYGGPR